MLHYEIVSHRSDLPWLLCLHGAGGNTHTWKFQVPALASYYQLLLVDLRDHGLSRNQYSHSPNYSFQLIAEDVLEVVEHLGISKLSTLSLSMGSMIAQQLVMLRPDLITYAIYAGGIFRVNIPIHLFAHSARFLSLFLPYRWMYKIFSWLVMPLKNHQFARRVYCKQAAYLSQSAFNNWTTLYRDFERTLKVFFQSKIEVPSLIIMGSQDYIFLKSAQQFASKSLQRKLLIIENCGHICNIEAAETFNQLVLQYRNERLAN